MKPETLSTKNIYKGRIFDFRVDKIREGDVEYEREIVAHNGSAVIVPVFEDGTVALVRQYRHAAGKYLLEIPAGTLEHGEDPRTGAHPRTRRRDRRDCRKRRKALRILRLAGISDRKNVSSFSRPA